jgi:hypothetical protein
MGLAIVQFRGGVTMYYEAESGKMKSSTSKDPISERPRGVIRKELVENGDEMNVIS